MVVPRFLNQRFNVDLLLSVSGAYVRTFSEILHLKVEEALCEGTTFLVHLLFTPGSFYKVLMKPLRTDTKIPLFVSIILYN